MAGKSQDSVVAQFVLSSKTSEKEPRCGTFFSIFYLTFTGLNGSLVSQGGGGGGVNIICDISKLTLKSL